MKVEESRVNKTGGEGRTDGIRNANVQNRHRAELVRELEERHLKHQHRISC